MKKLLLLETCIAAAINKKEALIPYNNSLVYQVSRQKITLK